MDSSVLSSIHAPSLLLGLSIFTAAVWVLRRPSSQPLPLPPGPRPLPILGNLFDIPKEKEWIAYRALSERYGDICHLEAFGNHIMVIGSAAVARELFDGRSANYFDRPYLTMGTDLCRYGEWSIATQPYGETWRQDRRAFNAEMHEGAVEKYCHITLRLAQAYARRFLEDPDHFIDLTLEYGACTLMDVVYGVQDPTTRNRYIHSAKEVERRFKQVAAPGAFLVDLVPIFRNLPAWFPGAGFHSFAQDTRKLARETVNGPLDVIKNALTLGNAVPCMTTFLLDHIESDPSSGLTEKNVRDAAATAYIGGADTQLAQEELDRVIGSNRLSTSGNYAALPYIQALILEVLRFMPSVSIAPHSTSADDEYNGYFIPKGSICMANIWAMLHDPETYHNPEEFRPERFLKKSADGQLELNGTVPDPRTLVYGFSWRKCPGRFLAEQMLFALITTTLATCAITSKVGEDGHPLVPPVELVSSGISCTYILSGVYRGDWLTPRSALQNLSNATSKHAQRERRNSCGGLFAREASEIRALSGCVWATGVGIVSRVSYAN